MNKADIAILLATYNGEKYLEEQLDSLLNQTEQNWTCYIHDDGSTDNTLKIVNEYILNFPQKFVLLDYPPQGGAKQNFISMLKHINEPYAMFCDQDDFWLPEKIEIEFNTILEEAKNNPDKGILVYSDSRVVDEKCKIIAESHLKYMKIINKTDYKFFLRYNCVQGSTIIMNRNLYLIAKNCNPNNIYMHDQWCALIAAIFGIITFINEPLMLYRQHDSNLIGVMNNAASDSRLKHLLSICSKKEISKRIENNLVPCIKLSGMLNSSFELPTGKKEFFTKVEKFKQLSILSRMNILRELGFGPLSTIEYSLLSGVQLNIH